MRIEQDADDKWFIVNADVPIAIGGKIEHDDRDELVSAIQGRGLFVWADGTISKTAEDVPVEAPVVSEEIVTEEAPAESVAVPVETVEAPTEAVEASTEPKTKKPAKPRKKKESSGSPRFTEEQRIARAEYARKYRSQMTEEQKEKARERARERQKRWRDSNPERAAEFSKRSSERRKERYNNDPEFRKEYREKQQEYAMKRSDSVE